MRIQQIKGDPPVESGTTPIRKDDVIIGTVIGFTSSIMRKRKEQAPSASEGLSA